MIINNDFNVIYHLDKHFNELNEEVSSIENYETFSRQLVFQKAIILDLIQIGENVNKLSDNLKSKLNKHDLRGIINFRNQLVHGYSNNDSLMIWNIIHTNIPTLIANIHCVAQSNYLENLHQLLNTEVKVFIDRKINSKHLDFPDIIYKVNYGHIENMLAPDFEFQDAYVLGIDEPIDFFIGKVIAIIHRKNDIEDKIIVANEKSIYSKEEIYEHIQFQEKYFDIEIIMS